jgi:hypothetical protein
MKLEINENIDLFEMSNVRGKYVKTPHKLPFSFYFSTKDGFNDNRINHGLRVKPVMNAEKMSIDDAGTLRLFGDWEFIHKNKVDSKLEKEMKNFFKQYKVLFAAVWEKVLPPDSLYDYFRGTITFNELMKEFDFYDKYKEKLDSITNLDKLETLIDTYNLYNLWKD